MPALLFFLSLLSLGSCGRESGEAVRFESTRFMMDTLVTVRLEGRPGTGEEQLKSAAVAALARMEEIAKATDRYDSPSSPLKELAKKAGSGSWVEVGPEVYFLQEEVRKLGAAAAALEPAAEGMVNTAMAPLIDLWAKARQELTLPKEQEIAAALALTDMSWVESKNKTEGNGSAGGFFLRLDQAGMGLDFGAVAKGYALEEAWQVLKDSGLELSGTIDAGGNLKTVGEKPGGNSWSIGVVNPLDQSKLLCAVSLQPDQVAATSGDYQRYAEIEGKCYHHLLSPKDGWPVNYNHSVTVITEEGLASDFYSTLLFLLPPEKALALAEATSDLETIIASADGKLYISSGLEGRIQWNQDLGGFGFAEV